MQYLVAFFSRPEEARDVRSGRFVRLTLPDKCVNFRDLRLNRSSEIRPEAVGGGIFDRFCELYKCRPEVAGDVICGTAVDEVGTDVRANCTDSMLSNGRVIRLFG